MLTTQANRPGRLNASALSGAVSQVSESSLRQSRAAGTRSAAWYSAGIEPGSSACAATASCRHAADCGKPRRGAPGWTEAEARCARMPRQRHPAAIAAAAAVLGAQEDRVCDELVRDLLDLPETEFLAW